MDRQTKEQWLQQRPTRQETFIGMFTCGFAAAEILISYLTCKLRLAGHFFLRACLFGDSINDEEKVHIRTWYKKKTLVCCCAYRHNFSRSVDHFGFCFFSQKGEINFSSAELSQIKVRPHLFHKHTTPGTYVCLHHRLGFDVVVLVCSSIPKVIVPRDEPSTSGFKLTKQWNAPLI